MKKTEPTINLPGVELDQEVAKFIMGWSEIAPGDMEPLVGYLNYQTHIARRTGDKSGNYLVTPFTPSTDIVNAMEVIAKMGEDGWSVSMTIHGPGQQNGVKFYRSGKLLGKRIFDVQELPGAWSVKKSLPHAICMAALLTLGL